MLQILPSIDLRGGRVVRLKQGDYSRQLNYDIDALTTARSFAEAGAQLASYYVRNYEQWKGFVGFGGAEEIRFRQPVRPGCRLYLIGQKLWSRHRRFASKIQGIVNGDLVYESTIMGVQL